MLPVEILRLIAAESPESYRAMLAIPPFARSLDPGIIADYMIAFGYSVEIYSNSTVWLRHGKHHRTDGPAIEFTDGSVIWFHDGDRHREDGPAVIYTSDGEEWYFKDLPHRVGGPAVITRWFDEWYEDGKLYRMDHKTEVGDIYKTEWYYDKKLHRDDGPAVEYTDGRVEWWRRGVFIARNFL